MSLYLILPGASQCSSGLLPDRFILQDEKTLVAAYRASHDGVELNREKSTLTSVTDHGRRSRVHGHRGEQVEAWMVLGSMAPLYPLLVCCHLAAASWQAMVTSASGQIVVTVRSTAARISCDGGGGRSVRTFRRDEWLMWS